MGAEATVAAILIFYILGTLGYTGFLAFSLQNPDHHKSAKKKLIIAIAFAFSASGWAATWWHSNFPAHLTATNVLVFAFLPALALGTLVAEVSFRIAKMLTKIRNPKT